MGMITDFNKFKKYLVNYDTFLSHHLRNTKNLKSIRGKLLFTTFISYNPVTNKISSNKVSRIIATDLHSSSRNIAFCAPYDDKKEKLPTSHGLWEESSDVDMLRWELPIFATYEEAEKYRKDMYKILVYKRNAHKEMLKKSTVTLEEIAEKFCINLNDLIIEGIWNDKMNKKRKRI